MSPRSSGPVRISPGFLLLLGWFGLINGCRLLGMVLGAAILHELGHGAVLALAGARIRGLRIGICGAVLEADTGGLSYGWELAAILAGPAMNLLCALLCAAGSGPDRTVWTGIHLALCGFNLLPLRPLDGGRALELASVWLLGPGRGEAVTRLAGAVSGLLAAGGLVSLMLRSGGSLWLLPAAGGLLSAGVREAAGNQQFL